MMEEVNILAEQKPKTIKLADGREYTLPPIDMTTLANIEKTMGFGGSSLSSQMNEAPMQTLRLMTYALLKENHPELSIEQAGRLVTFNEMKLFSETIASILAING